MAILFAQAALLEHEYDFAIHQSGDTCVTCLHATPLSHGMVGTLYFVPLLPPFNARFSLQALRASAVAAKAYRARAPPSVTSA